MTAAADAAIAEALKACRPLAELFEAAGHRLYLVGGVVRDALKGRFQPDADIDCTTAAPPSVVRRIVSPASSALWTQGERYGTIGCVIDGQAFEITTHRSECYAEASRKPTVAFGIDLGTDLSRRDFTVNAMAIDADDGALIDPHGGRRDLADGKLRTPLAPDVSFTDDPLRMLRAARFIAGHGLAPARGLAEAATALRMRLSIVAVERVRDEFEKLLLLPDPTRGFEFLDRTGLIEQVVPCLRSSDPGALGRTVGAAAASPGPRWASLFVGGPADAAVHLRAMRCSTALVEEVTGLLSARRLLASPPDDPPGIRRLVSACPVDVDAAADFTRSVAAARGQPALPLERFLEALAELRLREEVYQRKPPLTGDEVMALLGLEPGPDVGRALAFLRELAFEEGPMERPEAVAALRQWSSAGYCAEQ